MLSPLQREVRTPAERAESAIFWPAAVLGYVGVMLRSIRFFCGLNCQSHLHYGVLLDKQHKWHRFVEEALLFFTLPSAVVLALLLIWALARLCEGGRAIAPRLVFVIYILEAHLLGAGNGSASSG